MANGASNLDDLDHRLIALLRSDGRLPVAKVSRRNSASPAPPSPPAWSGWSKPAAIAGYTVMLRTSARSDAVRAITMVEIDGKNSEAVIRRLTGFPEIRTLYTTNGRWDVVAEVEPRTCASSTNSCARSTRSTASRTPRRAYCSTREKELG